MWDIFVRLAVVRGSIEPEKARVKLATKTAFGSIPWGYVRAIVLETTSEKSRKNWCLAHVATSPPHRNPIFTSKMIKNIEKMTVPFTEAAYLQQVVALEGRLCHITAFLQSDGRFCLPHFYGGSETCRFHCKTQQFFMICMPLMGFFFKIIVKRDVFRACRSNGKTGMFWHA